MKQRHMHAQTFGITQSRRRPVEQIFHGPVALIVCVLLGFMSACSTEKARHQADSATNLEPGLDAGGDVVMHDGDSTLDGDPEGGTASAINHDARCFLHLYGQCESCAATSCARECFDFSDRALSGAFLGWLYREEFESAASGEATKRFPEERLAFDAWASCVRDSCGEQCACDGHYSDMCMAKFASNRCTRCGAIQCPETCRRFSQLPGNASYNHCILTFVMNTPYPHEKCSGPKGEIASEFQELAPAYSEHRDCVLDRCKEECGSLGGCFDVGRPCGTCREESCWDECQDWMASGFVDLVDCYSPCADDACGEECAAQYPDVGKMRERLLECFDVTCLEECAWHEVP